jgi:(1->4)-alpha-D-glucan 1-alpha-D-glucosylmutase
MTQLPSERLSSIHETGERAALQRHGHASGASLLTQKISAAARHQSPFGSSQKSGKLQTRKEKPSGHIALEPFWVTPQQDTPINVPIYVTDFLKPRTLHARLQTEDHHTHDWDFSVTMLEAAEVSSVELPGFVGYLLPLPEALGLGYHELFVLDRQTGERAEMRLIVTPDKCYQPPAIQSGDYRLWGISVDLPRIASQRNWGLGDLSDLNRVIDWCAAQGADFVQLGNSGKSGVNPFLLLDVEAIEDFGECDEARKLVLSPDFQSELKKLRETPELALQAVEQQKLRVLHLLYRSFARNHIKKNSFRAHGFRMFLQKQGKRLEHLALYEALRHHFVHEDASLGHWQSWPDAYQHPDSPAVLEFAMANPERLGFYQYLYWQLDIQLHAAGLRSWEQALGIGLCLNFDWDVRHYPALAWSMPCLSADTSSRVEEASGPEETLPESALHSSEAFQFWIEELQHAMQHAGAICIESFGKLLPSGRINPAASDIDKTLQDFLGILALESQRHHCMVIADGIELNADTQAFLRQWNIFSARYAYRQNHCAKQAIQPGVGAWPQMEAIEPNTLFSVRGGQTPTLSDFWEGNDIARKNLADELSPEAAKIQRNNEIMHRALLRVGLLTQLENCQLLPEGMTPDPLSAPKITPELAAAVHQMAAGSPALLFLAHLDDMMMPGEGKCSLQVPSKYPLPLEDWSNDAALLTVARAVSQIRPQYNAHVATEVLPSLEAEQRTSLFTPRAIYRLQFNQNFTFRDAANLVPYLNRLGISHCYASPLLRARANSPHGYDITDHQQLNQEIGDLEDLRYFTDKLRMHGMGLIVDIVPNHMGAGKDNPWWMDVLENGRSSAYADYFDIDWNPLSDDLQNKILLAILGDSYGKILENGEIQLRFDEETGRFWLYYWEHQVPIDPATYPVILGYRPDVLETRLGHHESALLEYRSLLSAFENLQTLKKAERERERLITLNRLVSLCRQTPEVLQFIQENVQAFQPRKEHPSSLSRLNKLLQQQHYRLANWRVASDEINYRRFFDINDLIAVRVEDERVFEDTHELVMKLVEQGLIQGLRIDHPDGLYAPARYFRRLQTEAARRLGLPEHGAWHLGSPELPFYILIEKILAPFERLPEDWAVHGTTGYEFANAVNGLFICQENEKEFTRIYEKFIGKKVDFNALCYESKKLIMKTALNSELNVLTHQLHRLSKAHWGYQDFTLHNLRSALIEVVACFPVYRTYITEQGVSRKDKEYIEWAIRSAKRKNLSTDESVFDFLHAVLLTDVELTGEAAGFRDAVVHFAMKFQQYSSPVMAKGVEDTAFYRYNRLVSLNEVGGDPRQFGISVAHFHYQNLDRAKNVPNTLLATSTHDTKRSEDVRARISVLSEMPQAWSEHVHFWRRANRTFRKVLEDGLIAPSANDEYLFYQTLLGVWPFHEPNDEELESLVSRIEAYMLKAVREAKEHSSWVNPNAAYEAALSEFVRGVLLRPSRYFLEDFVAFHREIARFGALNSVSQTLLKLTSPGVPEFYQGSELLNFTLVDPDNRQFVDYTQRLQSLRQIDDMLELHDMTAFHQQLESLCNDLSDSRLKQFVISSVLHFRSAQPPLFREGEYIPLEVTGYRAEHIVAFARCWHGLSFITVAPRLFYTLGLRKKDRPCGRRVWRDTAVILPERMAGQSFRNLFDRLSISPTGNPAVELSVAEILRHLPVGLLIAN